MNMIIKLILCAAFVAAVLLAFPARAAGPQPASSAESLAPKEALTKCILEASTEEDRRALVNWIFMMMSKYPDLSGLVRIDAAQGKAISTSAGNVFTRLMADDCGSELRLALERSGTDAIGESFKVLGESAVETLLKDPAVAAESAAIAEYIDMERLGKAMQGNP